MIHATKLHYSFPTMITPEVTEALTLKHLLDLPKTPYMNDAHQQFFRQLLENLRSELQQNARMTSEHLRHHDETADPADRATLEEERTLELRARDRERKLLIKVEGALQRLDAGIFGYCEETDEPIGLARLFARPTATLSVEAQERRERRKRQFGD